MYGQRIPRGEYHLSLTAKHSRTDISAAIIKSYRFHSNNEIKIGIVTQLTIVPIRIRENQIFIWRVRQQQLPSARCLTSHEYPAIVVNPL